MLEGRVNPSQYENITFIKIHNNWHVIYNELQIDATALFTK